MLYTYTTACKKELRRRKSFCKPLANHWMMLNQNRLAKRGATSQSSFCKTSSNLCRRYLLKLCAKYLLWHNVSSPERGTWNSVNDFMTSRKTCCRLQFWHLKACLQFLWLNLRHRPKNLNREAETVILEPRTYTSSCPLAKNLSSEIMQILPVPINAIDMVRRAWG